MIPQNKIQDVAPKQKAFEEIKHEHEGNPTRLQLKQCTRCKFDTAEKSLVDYIKNHAGDEKTKSEDPNGVVKDYTFQKLTVVRGSLDDCIGWAIDWS